MTKLRYLSALAVFFLAAPANPQSISGCGTATPTKAEAKDATALQKKRACFKAAGDSAVATVVRLDVMIAALAPPAKPVRLYVGDSLSVMWSGNHTGIYAKAHPELDVRSEAVGGTGIADVTGTRLAADLAMKPATVVIFMGANDLPNATLYPAEADWLNAELALADKFRLGGAKVLLGTLIAQCNQPEFNRRAAIVNAAIRAQTAYGVVDYGADPVLGSPTTMCDKDVTPDGVHPYGEATGTQIDGQKRLAAIDDGKPLPTPDPNALVAPIPSNFDTASELVPAWGTGAIPVSAAPDIVGAFRFLCTPGQVKADDPIVYPGQPGKSHLHRFFGNTLTDANSTYASLRTTGDSTCMSKLNRSAYWQPEMMNGANGVPPLFWVIYYKRYPATSPFCKTRGEECVAIPAGLKFIFGYDMLTGKPATGSTFWQCVNPDGVTVINQHSATMTQALTGCQPGWQLEVRSEAPECWNGTALDSPNHRDHVAYMVNDPNTGQPSCDAAHPKIMPQFTLAAFWTVTANAGKWALSSDAMMKAEPGVTFHSDFFAAWDPPTEAAWTAACIDKLLNCSGGDLGNGWQLKAH